MWISLILALAGKIFDLFGLGAKLAISKEEFLAQVQVAKFETADDVLKAAAEVVKAEIGGESWLQRSWRPIVALSSYYAYFFVLFVYPFAVVEKYLPQVKFGEAGLDNMFNLVLVCVGGYIAGRTFEKVWGK